MKFKILLILLLVSGNVLFAQDDEKGPCDCGILESEQKGYVNEKQANMLLQRYIKQLAPLSKIKEIKDEFQIRVALCNFPKSQICISKLPDGTTKSVRLILYSNFFLNRLNAQDKSTTLVDKHVLLHELGHHVLGHHKNARSIEALQKPYENERPDPKGWAKYGAANPMAQELEADIYAVWALSKLERGFLVSDLVKGFDTETLRLLDKESAAATQAPSKEKVVNYLGHPRFKDRIETMEKFETELKKAPARVVPPRYFANIASTAYLALWPEAYVYDVSLSVGTSIAGKTNFSVGKEKTDAFLYPVDDLKNYHFGLSLDRFRWDRLLQTGLDMQWSQHKYGTTVPTTDGSRLTETLSVRYVTFTPRLTWNSIGVSKQQSLHSWRVGFLLGIGLNARIPVGKVSYTNYVSNAATPGLQFSVGPKATVGAAIMRKSFLPRGFKVLFSYDPQWIRLKTEGNPVAWSHNLECTLQCSLKRW